MLSNILLLAALPEEADAFMPGQGRVVDTRPHPVRRIEREGRSITASPAASAK
jgi:hypothetical protein